MVGLTAIVFLAAGRDGNNMCGYKVDVEPIQGDFSLSFLYPHKSEHLAEAFPKRLSSLSVSSKDHPAEILALNFFNKFSTNLAAKSGLTGVPLLCRSCQHTVNIHGP